MANSYELGGDGGGRPTETPFDARIGAPEKARSPSDPVYGKSPEGDDAESAANLGATAKAAAEALERKAAQLAEDVGDELSRMGQRQKARGVDALHRVARAIDGAADELEDQSPIAARTAREAARQLDGFSDAIAGRSVNDLVDQAMGLARRRPVLFVGGSVAAGFVVARFLMTGARGSAARSMDPPLQP
ncbi:hypothetical protein DFR50_14039 [Roseiarcus fermentans]|uniref:ElaB/YqjD/DUF883 family membrane-anchored ribosome-binding protein n=1 Tax=Roseiarcus fermentans TaxID=1473586 RepID=A0A366EQD7_9HYPH|nr:hypothetical protein [Roseiarcus fermentans]RBP04166.1 hypothetical protein DFR50_14039 [Roseiarcus fermentans]